MLRDVFKRREARPDPADNEPPRDLAAKIDGASLLSRSDGDEARVMVMMHGLRPFHFSEEGAAKAMQILAPELNDTQTARAVSHLGSRVAKALRDSVQPIGHDDEPRWRDWRPLEKI